MQSVLECLPQNGRTNHVNLRAAVKSFGNRRRNLYTSRRSADNYERENGLRT